MESLKAFLSSAFVAWVGISAPQLCRAAQPMPCSLFKVHNSVVLPQPPNIIVPETLPKNWESDALTKISKIKTQEEFSKIYLEKSSFIKDLTDRERFEYLQCVTYYVSMDSNHNGIPDWSAIIDHSPARVLFPADEDIDGDGVANVLDPDPLDPAQQGRPLASGEIPDHLKIDAEKRPEAYRIQKILYRRYGILAIDHTDEHSPAVLKELLFLLDHGIGSANFKSLKNLKYVYAFAGHDQDHNIASFHLEAKALSIGGVQSYGKSEDLKGQIRSDLLVALAHEIGHAFLFEKMSPEELAQLANEYGGWKIKKTVTNNDFFDSYFFRPHPLNWLASQIFLVPAGREALTASTLWKSENIVSQYATSNIHEWFADAFAAHILIQMGTQNLLEDQWRSFLTKVPKRKSSYWTNYNNLSSPLQVWLSKKLLP